MRCSRGRGYTLYIYENERALAGPGLVYCYSGEWEVGDDGQIMHAGQGAEILGRVEIAGDGILAVAEPEGQIVFAPVERTDKPWGFEECVRWGYGAPLLLKRIVVDEGKRTSLQSHEHKDEIILPLEGDGGPEFENDDEWYASLAPMWPRNAFHITPGRIHRTYGPVDFIEASTYHPNDVIRHEDDFGR